MAHGFGVSIDDMKVDELVTAAVNKGYEADVIGQYTDDDIGCSVNMADITGVTIGVRVVGGKYYVQGKRKEICYTTLNGALNCIAKAMEQKKNYINKLH